MVSKPKRVINILLIILTYNKKIFIENRFQSHLKMIFLLTFSYGNEGAWN